MAGVYPLIEAALCFKLLVTTEGSKKKGRQKKTILNLSTSQLITLYLISTGCFTFKEIVKKYTALKLDYSYTYATIIVKALEQLNLIEVKTIQRKGFQLFILSTTAQGFAVLAQAEKTLNKLPEKVLTSPAE